MSTSKVLKSNDASASGKNSAASERKKIVKVNLKSPLEGVDLMVLKDVTAAVNAKEQLHAFFTAKYGEQGNFISTGEQLDAPENGLDQLDVMDLPVESKAELKNKLALEYIKRCIDFDSNYVKMYGQLLLVMDKEGLDRVKSHVEYKDVEKNMKKPLNLWNLMVKVYNGGRGFATNDEIELKTRAKLNYDRCYQGEHMSLLDFKRVLENARQNLVVSKCTYQPTDQDFAADFLEKVNRSRYGAAVAHIKNAAAMNKDLFPKTVDDAFQMLETIESRNVKYSKINTGIKNTAFVSTRGGKKGDKSQNKSHTNSESQNKSHTNSESQNKGQNSENNSSITEKKKTMPCHQCGQLGHWKNECPDNQKVYNANVCYYGSVEVLKVASKIKKGDMIYDTGATEHIYIHPELCDNIREVNESIQGLGSTVKVNQRGDMPIFGECILLQNEFTLMSACRIERMYRVKFNQLDSYEVIIDNGKVIKFKYNADIGLYICKHEEYTNAINNNGTNINSCYNVNSVESNKLGYSNSELKRVEMVKDLIKSFGYTSFHEIYQVIKNGVIHDCPLTTTDVLNWNKIYGFDVNHIKGSFTDKGAAGTMRMEPMITVKTAQVLNIDIFYFDRVTELISVSKPMNMVMATLLKTRKMDEIRSAIAVQVNAYNGRGFTVKEIDGDNEFMSLDNSTIEGAVVHTSGACNPIAERNGGVAKNRARSVESSLPYDVAPSLTPELVNYVVSMMNWVPRAGGVGEAARVIFDGRKLKMKEIELCFGDYCQVYDKSIVRTNDINKPRTIGCIAMRSLFNGTGSWRFYNIATKKSRLIP